MEITHNQLQNYKIIIHNTIQSLTNQSIYSNDEFKLERYWPAA